MSLEPLDRTRRNVLAVSGAVAAFALAGCLGEEEPAETGGNHDDIEDDDHATEDENDHDDEDVAEEYFDHLGVADEGFVLLDRAHDPHEDVAYVHGDHWDGTSPTISLGEYASFGASVELEDGDELEFGDEYELRVEVPDDAPEGIVEIDEDEDFHGDHVYVHGEDVGITEVVFLIWHDDHADYRSPPIDVQVVDEDEADDEGDHDHDEFVSEFQLLDRAHDPHEELSYVDGDHWHGEDEFPTIPIGDNVSIGAYIEDADGEEIVLGTEYELGVELAEGAEEGVVEIDEAEGFHGYHVYIYGESDGETEIVFTLIHDDHVDYETPPLTAEVAGE